MAYSLELVGAYITPEPMLVYCYSPGKSVTVCCYSVTDEYGAAAGDPGTVVRSGNR